METFSQIFQSETKIDSGTRSVCYRKGDKVYKINGNYIQKDDALEAAKSLRDNYTQLVTWLGEYVTPTNIGVSKIKNGYSVVAEQPFINGISIKKALLLASKEHLKINEILDFLKKSLAMYEKIQQVPDIFGRPHIFGWHNVITTPNVLVEKNNQLLIPKLLDIGFARLSQNPFTGPIHNKLLAMNISRTIKEIDIP